MLPLSHVRDAQKMRCLISEIGTVRGRCLMGKIEKYDYKPYLNKDDYKWIALIVAVVFLFCIGRTKTIEDYERGMDSQSMKDIK
tara:strand:+ start:822 stop:1073 length:252 start_codon:yes stop_codon:yes gene_type:complete